EQARIGNRVKQEALDGPLVFPPAFAISPLARFCHVKDLPTYDAYKPPRLIYASSGRATMLPAKHTITTHSLRTASMGRAVVGRGFALSTSCRHGLKESSGPTAADLDRHKQDSLAKQRRGAGHWKPELASDSEEAVRADRAPPEDVAGMQQRTKLSAEETRRAGTSTRDAM
ncbi:Uncharacterized protein TCAP_04443, partial [Tolypocladium capitatum]